jgi:hypothetical protein
MTDLIKPGIYFGMPEDIYHDDPALGSTDLKELALDPIEYQYGRLHGEERTETFALKWGSAIHCRMLEGRAALAERFPVEPDKSDYPDLLDTMDDLRERCSSLGIKPGRTKAEAIANIRQWDPKVPIWEEIVAGFRTKAGNKTTLPRTALAEIERAVEWMQRDPYLAPVMEDGTMTAGASEVSIFYEDNGVRLKARIDHLLSHAIVDLKSFRPVFREQVKRAAVKAIERQRYDLQAASYVRAIQRAAELYSTGQVFSNPYGPEFLDAVFSAVADGSMKWVWVLIKASGAPQPVVRELNLDSMIFRTASDSIERAIDDYRTYSKDFGPDSDWAPSLPAEVLSDEDFSPYSFM